MLRNKNTLVVFGDSNVWGAELKDVPTRQSEFKSVVYDPADVKNWPYHIRHSFSGVIAEQLGMKILNLAIPGCSNDTIFRRVNKFVQGNYPVNLEECFVMVFWTGVVRREFFRSDTNVYLNYSPLWANSLQLIPKFHKIYSKHLLHEGYDLNKAFNYIYSINGLLSYKQIEFLQGYALQDERLADAVKEAQIPNFISYDPYDAVCALPIVKGWNLKNNPLIFPGQHPTEMGHKYIAKTYLEMIDKLDKQ